MVLSKMDDPLVEDVDSDFVSAAELILMLKSRDMFDERRRVIRMRGLPADYDLLTDYLSLVSDDNVLVFYGPVGYFSKARFVNVKSTNFYKTIAGYDSPPAKARMLHFPEEFKNDSEATEWIGKVIAENNKVIEPKAAQLLVEYKGRDIDTLYSELLKLCDYQTAKKITAADVEDCCIPAHLKTVWDFVDSFLLSEYDKGVGFLEKFYEEAGAENKVKAEGQNIIGALVSVLTFVLFLKTHSCSDVSSAKNLLSGVNKTTTDEGKLVNKPMFDGYYIMKNMSKPSIRNALKWSNKKIYNIMDAALSTRIAMRVGDDSLTRSSFNFLLMVVCDRMDYRSQEAIVCGM